METLRVLVCDDELGMRMGVARALRHFTTDAPDVEGGVAFQVIEAETGERALDIIQASPPDILLLDQKLPGISGLDVLEALSKKSLSILTIMITAYATIETAVRATKQGAHDFLPKPFTPAELKSTIEKAARHLLMVRQARQLAEEKRRLRFEFISVVAHELKAPLNAVEGYLSLLQTPDVQNDKAVHDHIIDRSVIRISGMRKMITDLLDLTRIESGQKPREIGDMDVREAALAAMETTRPEAQSRHIAIQMEAAAPVPFVGDKNELEIVMNNLVSNAVKYNRDDGTVTITLTPATDGVTIMVSDTGIGMTPEEVNRLFKDFTRIKNKKTKGILGSGLGLSIVKKIAAMYNGDVSVKSEADKGTTFTVHLRNAKAVLV